MPELRVVLAVDSLRSRLTGIGQYTWSLLQGLRRHPAIAELAFLGPFGWVHDAEHMLEASAPGDRAFPHDTIRSAFARGVYSMVSPLLKQWLVRQRRDWVFHSPNFAIPPIPNVSVATIHDLSPLRYPQFHPTERVARLRREIPRAVDRARVIIVDSELIRDELVATYPHSAEKVRVIPLAADKRFRPRPPQDLDRVLSPYGLRSGAYTLFVGTLEPRKNLDGLLRAYAKLPSLLRERFPLAIAGMSGWRVGPTVDLLERAVKGGYAVRLGYVPSEDLPFLYAGSRAFLYPSWYEGFGLPVLEALACGIPSVVGRSTAPVEIIRDTGAVADPASSDSIAGAIESLLADDQLNESNVRRRLGYAARYSWKHTVEATVAAYRVAAECNAP